MLRQNEDVNAEEEAESGTVEGNSTAIGEEVEKEEKK